MTLRLFPVVLVFASLLTACGAGSGMTPAHSAAPSRSGSANVRIIVPAGARSQGHRSSYVSSATKSVSISVNGATPVVTQLTTQSTSCSTTGQGLQCTVTVGAPYGNDSFAVSLFASTDGSGPALATQTISTTVSQSAPATVSISLGGVVASIGLSLANSAPTEGSAATIPLTVTALDASGATIVGTDPFTAPIAISDSDTSGATSLSATQVASPAAGSLSVHYTGAASTMALFTATSGSATAHATLSSVPPPQTLWVANNGGNDVLAYSSTVLQGGGGSAPTTTISGANTGFSSYSPQCVRFNASGDLIVVGSYGANSPGAVEVFASPTTGGNLSPSAVISGASTTLTTPVGCALDASGNLWIANDDNFSYSVVMFSASQLSSGGNVAPARVIAPTTCCGNSSLCNTVSMAFDPSGNLWTGSLCAPTAEFSASSIATSGSPVPAGYFGQSGGANGIAFDSSGNLWTAIGTSVTRFNAANLPNASSGTLTADATISGALTQFSNTVGVTFDRSGNLWVSDAGSSSILEFSASALSAGGNIAPAFVLSGASSLLTQPNGLTFH